MLEMVQDHTRLPSDPVRFKLKDGQGEDHLAECVVEENIVVQVPLQLLRQP